MDVFTVVKGRRSIREFLKKDIPEKVHVCRFYGKSAQFGYSGEAHTAVKERAPQLGELLTFKFKIVKGDKLWINTDVQFAVIFMTLKQETLMEE